MTELGLSCDMWALVPWPGIEPRLPALGARNLSHWTTRGTHPLWVSFKKHWEKGCILRKGLFSKSFREKWQEPHLWHPVSENHVSCWSEGFRMEAGVFTGFLPPLSGLEIEQILTPVWFSVLNPLSIMLPWWSKIFLQNCHLSTQPLSVRFPAIDALCSLLFQDPWGTTDQGDGSGRPPCSHEELLRTGE